MRCVLLLLLLLLPAATSDGQSLTDNLIAYWSFDEASGTRSDGHGTLHLSENGTVAQVGGLLGGAADFDGNSANFLSLANSPAAPLRFGDSDFTIAFWCYPDVNTAAYRPMFSMADAAPNRSWRVGLYEPDPGGFSASISADGSLASARHGDPNNQIVVGQWNFVVLWYDSTDDRYYVEINNSGSPVYTSHSGGSYAATTADFKVGRHLASAYDGRIDETVAWSRTLTAGERAFLFNGGLGRTYSDLLGNPATRYVAEGGADGSNECTVATQPCATVQHAINRSKAGDTVQIAGGIYTEANIEVDHDLTIRGVDSAATIVQAAELSADPYGPSGTDRVFYIGSGDVIIERMTIRNGDHATGGGIYSAANLLLTEVAVGHNRAGPAGGFGGGIFNGGNLTLDRCKVHDNVILSGDRVQRKVDDVPLPTMAGAGIYSGPGSTLTIRSSSVVDNWGDAYQGFGEGFMRGGGIAVGGVAEITASIIQGNRIFEQWADGTVGGGVSNWGTMTIRMSSIDNNRADVGGGVYNEGTLVVIESTINGNEATVGGGLANVGSLEIQESSVCGNSAEWFGDDKYGHVGGILSSGDLHVRQSTICNNRSSESVGGLLAGGEGAVLENSTVYGNVGCANENFCWDPAPGGVAGAVVVKNTIIAGNVSLYWGQLTDCDANLESHGYNLIEDPSGCTITEAENGGTDIFGASPKLGPSGDNGGPTETLALRYGSPAIDAGSCIDIAGNGITTDQRGYPRDDGVCDIGAFELDQTCDLTWVMSLNVEDSGQGAATLLIGQGATPTDDLDGVCGELELPPAPPTGSFDVRTILPDGTTASLSDFRGNDQPPVTWKIEFQPGTGGYPITFSWDWPGSILPGIYTLKDEITGDIVNVDMTAQNSYTLTNSAITSLLIVYSEMTQSQVTYGPSWNLISVPLEADDMSVSALFPSAVSNAFSFASGYEVSDPLSTGIGYWLKFGGSGSETISGQPVSLHDISAASGWNIVGPFEASVDVSEISSTPAGIISSQFFGYEGAYVTVSSLTPGTGYWVKTTSTGTLHLGGAGKAVAVLADLPSEEWPRVNLTSTAGHTATLYLSPEDGVGGFDLPPRPPVGTFDVRFAGDRYVAPADREAVVEINEGPVWIEPGNLDARALWIRDGVTGNLFSKRMVEGDRMLIPEAHDRIRIRLEAELPADYALLQNYPNPFNPATTIRYDLPEASHVRLSLFDPLGREMKTLVDARREPGRYEVIVQAENLASGIYLYRIEAGDFRDVKRMILVK